MIVREARSRVSLSVYRHPSRHLPPSWSWWYSRLLKWSTKCGLLAVHNPEYIGIFIINRCYSDQASIYFWQPYPDCFHDSSSFECRSILVLLRQTCRTRSLLKLVDKDIACVVPEVWCGSIPDFFRNAVTIFSSRLNFSQPNKPRTSTTTRITSNPCTIPFFR